MESHVNHFSSLRLWASSVQNEFFSHQILRVLKEYPRAFDDVWLGTLLSLPPLKEHACMAAKNGEFAQKLREIGLSVSL